MRQPRHHSGRDQIREVRGWAEITVPATDKSHTDFDPDTFFLTGNEEVEYRYRIDERGANTFHLEIVVDGETYFNFLHGGNDQFELEMLELLEVFGRGAIIL